MLLSPVQTTRFRHDVRRMVKSGKDISLLEAIVRLLCNQQTLPPRNKDHALVGNWTGCRECHLTPDWLLIYRIEPTELVLLRTGSHSDLF
jgi:mRNA interferase YafQ